MSFTFGTPTTTAPSAFGTPTQGSSFNFGAGDAANKPAFSFGGSAATTKPGGFSFVTPSTTTTTAPSFNISATSPPSVAFGTPKTSSSLLLGSSPTTTTASSQFHLGSGTGLFASTPPSGLSFGSPTLATAAQPALGLPAGTVATPPQFGFSSGSTTAAPSLPAFGTPTTTTAQTPGTGFSFGTSTGGLTGFGTTPIKPAATQAAAVPTFGSSLPAFGSSLSSLTVPAPSLGQNVASIASTGIAFGPTSATTAPSLFGQSTASFAAPKPVTSTAIAQLQPLASDQTSLFGNSGAKPALALAAGATTTAPSLPAFSLPSSQPPKPQSFSLTPASTISVGIQLGTVAPSIPSAGLQLSASTAATPVPAALQFGAAPVTTTATVTSSAPSAGFPLGMATSTPSGGFQLGAAASISTGGIQPGIAAPAPTVGLQLGTSTVKTTLPGAQPTANLSLPGAPFSSLGSVATSAIATVSMPTATTTGLGGAFQPPSTSGAGAGATATGGASLTTPTVTSAATPQPPSEISSMSFAQLEEMINKWTLDLEEQEKIFINQATQVNAWDRLLIANGEKIVQLNDAIQGVQAEQSNLDYELDFVLAQQRELEELLVPLEKELANVTVADPEREQIYNMAENVDTQLKSMSEDLKEVIDHLNESNRNQDSNDPIVQIGRILNAHMSSLQWIDSSTAQISTKLDQLTAMRNALRRDNERTFHLTYN